MIHPLARSILSTLAELAGDDALLNCYGFRRDHAADGCPLDAAVFAWLDAGCPIEVEPGPDWDLPDPEDLRRAIRACRSAGDGGGE